MTLHLLEKDTEMPFCYTDRKFNHIAVRKSPTSLQALKTHPTGSAPKGNGLAIVLAQHTGSACHNYNCKQGSLMVSPMSFKNTVSSETTALGCHAKCCSASYVVRCCLFLLQPRASGSQWFRQLLRENLSCARRQ